MNLFPVHQDGKHGFVKDDSGNFIRSRLNEEALQSIATITGGLYAPLGDRGQGLEKIYQQKLALIPKDEIAERRKKIPIERFPWAIAMALIFVIAEFLLGNRKRKPFSFRIAKLGTTTLLPLLLATSLFRPRLVTCFWWRRSIYKRGLSHRFPDI